MLSCFLLVHTLCVKSSRVRSQWRTQITTLTPHSERNVELKLLPNSSCKGYYYGDRNTTHWQQIPKQNRQADLDTSRIVVLQEFLFLRQFREGIKTDILPRKVLNDMCPRFLLINCNSKLNQHIHGNIVNKTVEMFHRKTMISVLSTTFLDSSSAT